MAEIRINATGGLKLYDADDSHYAQILAGTISSNVDALTLGSSSATFGLPVTVGEDDTGHDVKLFGATASRYWLWDESADGVVQRGTLTVGVDDTGHDVKLFGASAGAYMEWDESEDQLRIMGASADATTSTGKLLLATSLTDINANDEIGKIEFQAPHEAGGTDAIAVAASIQAVAQATFTSSVNATDLIFNTGHSEAAAEKIRITSQNEIGIAGANYGTDGQVLTSGGAGAAVAWEDAAGFDVSSITGATELSAHPATDDELVMSDGGTLKRINYEYINPNRTVAWHAVLSSASGSVSNDSWTKIACNTEVYDIGGNYDNSSNFRFTVPSGGGGKYLVWAYVQGGGSVDEMQELIASIYKNGSVTLQRQNEHTANTIRATNIGWTEVLDLNATDYLELFGYAQHTGTLTFKDSCSFGGMRLDVS